MGIKKFETRNYLGEKLGRRGLVFDEKDMKKALIEHNYFHLFSGIESLLLESYEPKRYEDVKLRDFFNIYNFDKEMTSIVLGHLNYIEERLKASISYHFCKRYCYNVNNTMQYTNKNNFMNPANGDKNSNTYCPYHDNYPFVNAQNKAIYHGFSKFILTAPFFLSNLIDNNDNIDIRYYRDEKYNPPDGVAVYRSKNQIYDRNVAVPFWVAIETLTFGELLRVMHYLKNDVMEDVMRDFRLKLSKREVFLNMMDFFLCLRNSCAHNSLVSNFSTSSKYRVNSLLVATFKLNPRNAGHQYSVLRLYDVVKMLSYFVDVSNLKEPIKNIKVANIASMGTIKGEKINGRLFERMGCEDYAKWDELTDGVEYVL